jgi:hypothetical protein
MTVLRNRVNEMWMVKAADLVPREANWRTHPPEHLQMMYLLPGESSIPAAIPNQASLRFPRSSITNLYRPAYDRVFSRAGSAPENY